VQVTFTFSAVPSRLTGDCALRTGAIGLGSVEIRFFTSHCPRTGFLFFSLQRRGYRHRSATRQRPGFRFKLHGDGWTKVYARLRTANAPPPPREVTSVTSNTRQPLRITLLSSCSCWHSRVPVITKPADPFPQTHSNRAAFLEPHPLLNHLLLVFRCTVDG
jgi:hypothetical protein